MGIAPNPLFPERMSQSYDRDAALNIPANRGPLRHEEGIATDTDVPSDFIRGAFGDTRSLRGRLNRIDPGSIRKEAAETMQERAHVGSAAWVEAPTLLSDFMQGAGVGQTPPQFERVVNSGAMVARRSQTVILD